MGVFDGKAVLVTGASSGIGAAAAEAFAREGAAVAVMARSREALEEVAGRVRAQGVASHVLVADVTDRVAVQAAVEEAAAVLGGLDVLVLNAAAMVFGRFWEVEAEAFDRTMDVTFKGAVDVTRAALPHLAASEAGTIVATGSTMARVPLPTFNSYAAAKHALRGFLNSLRVELRAAGVPVRVVMVHPGPVNTPLWDHVSSHSGRLPRRPPDRYTPESVARALVLCASGGPDEFTVGGEARLLELFYASARPLADRALTVVDRFYRTGRAPAPAVGVLAAGSGDARRAPLRRTGRPSVWARLRLPRGRDRS